MSEQERAEQAIEALVRRAIEVARPIDKVSKIRPRTFEDGHNHGLIEAIAIVREHFPVVGTIPLPEEKRGIAWPADEDEEDDPAPPRKEAKR